MIDKKKLLLWDADYLAFKHKKDSTLQEAIDNVEKHISEIVKFSGCTHFSMFLSGGRYFRHKIAENPAGESSYKANRGALNLPWVKAIKAYLEVKYEANYGNGYEADDSLGYFYGKKFYFGTFKYGKPEDWNLTGIKDVPNPFAEFDATKECISNVETILCSCDKDILNSFIGKNLNPSKKTGANLWEPVWIETNFDDAKEWTIYQLIGGDVGDNVKTKFPESCGLFNSKMSLEEVLHGYIYGLKYETPKGMKKFIEGYGVEQGVFEFSNNFRLLHILRKNEDFMREIGKTPEFPTIIDVKSLTSEPETKKVEF